jgi:hypothetical protein
MLNCLEATQLLSEAQDRPLTLKERVSLRIHLAMCTGCHNCKLQMSALRRIVKAYEKSGHRK